MAQILFLSLFLLVIFGSHFFIFKSISFFIGIFGVYRLWFAAVLIALPLLFVISSVLAHYFFNYFFRAFYFISGLWLALALNLIVALTAIWILFGLSKYFNLNIDFKILGWIGIICSVLFVLYGIWHAYDLKIKNITVGIKDLPEEWYGKKAVQISDVHLGYVYGKDYLQSLVDKVNRLNPDIVFITGDLLDGMDGHLEELVAPLNGLHPVWGTYFVTGNHETYLGVDKAFNALSKTNVKILNDKLEFINGMQLVGLSFPSGEIRESRDFSLVLPSLGFTSSKPSILLYHAPMGVEKAKGAGVNLFLAGHTHVGQLFPLGFITKIIYAGYDYGFHQDGDFSIYTSSGAGTWGPTARTSKDSEITLINFESK